MRTRTGKLARALLACVLAAALAACASAPPAPVIVARPVVLPLPVRPTLAPVAATAVRCLTDATYSALVARERALRTWALALQAVIQANNRAAALPAQKDAPP